MASTPSVPPVEASSSVAGPARFVSSRQSLRADPISRASSAHSTRSALLGESSNIADILGHAARLAQLDPASFPTLYSPSVDRFPDSQLTIAPLIAQLVSMVNDLGSTVAALANQVSTLQLAQAPSHANAPPPVPPGLEASLKHLSAQVAALQTSSHRTVPPPPPAQQPSTSSSNQATGQPTKLKKKLVTRLSSRTIVAPDFPIQFESKWYGNPDSYSRRYPDSPQAAILFASRHPESEEAKIYSDRYPATALFLTGPPPGFTVSSPNQPSEPTWAQVTKKSNKGKKNATAAQVAASSKTSIPKMPPPLPAAKRRFYAPRLFPTAPADPLRMTATLPDTMATVLKEANCALPLAFTAAVNKNGAVTMTSNPYTPASLYSPFFDAMTKKLNQSFPVGENPFQTFRPAPTHVELLIHSVPLFALPEDPAELFSNLLESISNAIDVPIFGARFLQNDPTKRAAKLTTSVVVAVNPEDVPRFGDSIRLFSRARNVRPAYSASKSTQCKKCWHFGHSAPLCKEDSLVCPICSLPHHRSAHRCANQSCPKGGFEKSVVGCCSASPLSCINCQGPHASFDGSCPVRRDILAALRPPRDLDVPDAPPDSRLPSPSPATPALLNAQATIPDTPARHAHQLPPHTDSSQPDTVRQARGTSFRSILAAPLPQRNLFGAGGSLFPANTSADWSEPQQVDEDMEI